MTGRLPGGAEMRWRLCWLAMTTSEHEPSKQAIGPAELTHPKGLDQDQRDVSRALSTRLLLHPQTQGGLAPRHTVARALTFPQSSSYDNVAEG